MFSGTQLQFLQAGGQSVDYGRGIAASNNGSAVATGLFRYSGKFGPLEVGEAGQGDMYVARVSNSPLINFRQGDEDFVWTGAGVTTRLMPNPAAPNSPARLEVTGLSTEAASAQLVIQYLAGRTLATRTVAVNDGSVSETLSTPMEAGVYLIRLQTPGSAPVTHRLTVQ